MNFTKKKLLSLTVGAGGCVLSLWFFYFRPIIETSGILTAYGKNPKPNNLIIICPLNGTVFPPEIFPPTFQWNDAGPVSDKWLISIRFNDTKGLMNVFVRQPQWKPSKKQWEAIKKRSREQSACVAVIGLRHAAGNRIVSSAEIAFSTSKDSVGNPLFYREVVLPFSEAVKDPSRIRWRFGPISGEEQPPVVLEKLPVCGNCHSFSADGKTLGMDVDYANDKGAYAVTSVAREVNLVTSDIITWSDFRRDEKDPTFGLLSQVSPDGRFVASTVKDRSVFVAKPDLAFSQLFFPIQGILAIYSRDTRSFRSLPGADNPALVQSNPSWSPDGRFIVFARSTVYRLKKLRNKAQVLLSPEECSEFLTNQTLFKFDLYRIPFNGGKGGVAEPLNGAANNGMSNFFAKYSPDGRWIVFCKSASFMLLQPDSKLYIMPANGGGPRLMRCNTGRMNSWHTWSSNSRWLVFSSKQNSPYTQLFITHIDEHGNDAPPVLLEHLTLPDRAANIPEFVYNDPRAIARINERFIDDVSLWRAGMAFWEAHDFENAKQKFREALRLNSANIKAHIAIGNICELQNDTAGALDAYTNAVKIDSLSSLARINLGNIFLKLEKYDLAIQHYTAAARISPHDMFAHYNLAEAYQKTGLIDRAIEEFNKAQAAAPDDASTCIELGKAYLTIGNMAGAEAQYRTALRCDSTNATRWFDLAQVLRKEKKTAEALQCYRKAAMLDPGFRQAVDSATALRRGTVH